MSYSFRKKTFWLYGNSFIFRYHPLYLKGSRFWRESDYVPRENLKKRVSFFLIVDLDISACFLLF